MPCSLDRGAERGAGHEAAEHVVRGDVGEREIALAAAVLILAVVDEGVDRDHLDAGIGRLLERRDQLLLVGRRDQDRIGLARGHRVQHGHLDRRVEVGAALEDQLDAERVGGMLSALAHGDVEGVRGEAGNERDRRLVLRLGRARDERRRDQGAEHGANSLQHKKSP